MAPYYCFQMEMDLDVVDPNLEDPGVLQVLSRILQVDKAPDLGVLGDLMALLITDHPLVEMDHLMTISKVDLHLEEGGEVLVTAEVLAVVAVLAVVVAEVFATDLLDLEVILTGILTLPSRNVLKIRMSTVVECGVAHVTAPQNKF